MFWQRRRRKKNAIETGFCELDSYQLKVLYHFMLTVYLPHAEELRGWAVRLSEPGHK